MNCLIYLIRFQVLSMINGTLKKLLMKYILILLLLSSCTIGGKFKTATGLNHKEQKKWVNEIRKQNDYDRFDHFKSDKKIIITEAIPTCNGKEFILSVKYEWKLKKKL